MHRVALACVVVVLSTSLSVIPATTGEPRLVPPANVPPTWTQFAKLLRYRFEERLSSDDPISARFRVYLTAQARASDGPPATLIVSVWIRSDGAIDRLVFDPFRDAGATKDFIAILTRGRIGEAPPPDMVQPVRLKFNLKLSESRPSGAHHDPR